MKRLIVLVGTLCFISVTSAETRLPVSSDGLHSGQVLLTIMAAHNSGIPADVLKHATRSATTFSVMTGESWSLQTDVQSIALGMLIQKDCSTQKLLLSKKESLSVSFRNSM